jgi:transcription antitermination factor NusG
MPLPGDTWFAVQVVPRWELRVASVLEYKGFQQFAPTYFIRKRWSDRVKTLEKPLFPGYVFVRALATTPTVLLRATPGVIRLVSFGGRPCAVSEVEIDAVRKLTLLGQPRPTQHVSVGQKVEIREGPFAGIVGIVREIKDRACLIVSVQLISQSIYVDVDEFQVGSLDRGSESSIGYCNSLRSTYGPNL